MPRDVRRGHQSVAPLHELVAQPVLHDPANRAALGVPEDQARTGLFLDAEQVQLLAELAVVALLGFLEPVQVRLQILLVEERGAIDTLQALAMLVALPVRTRHRKQLEGLDPPHRGHVRSATEVREQLACPVHRHARLVSLLLDQLALHELALRAVLGQCLFARDPDALVLGIALRDLLHARFDLLQVVRGERLVAVHVVEEALLGGRADAELRIGIQLEGRGCQQVRRRMAVDLERLLVPIRQESHADVLVEGGVQIGQPAIDLGDEGRPSQARTDPFRDFERGRARLDLHALAVR